MIGNVTNVKRLFLSILRFDKAKTAMSDRKFEIKIRELRDAGRGLMNSLLPMSVRIAGYEIEDVKLVLGGPRFRTRSAELWAIIRVLRACISGDRKAPTFADDLRCLESAANKNVRLKSEARSKEGSFFIRELAGSWEREAVSALVRYTDLLASDTRLAAHAPIGICENCRGIFWRAKRNQRCCSDKCRMARWSGDAGREYFAKAQRRRRAELRAKELAGRTPSNHARKNVVKSEVKLSKIRREKRGNSKKN
jgi:hypothetical protein